MKEVKLSFLPLSSSYVPYSPPSPPFGRSSASKGKTLIWSFLVSSHRLSCSPLLNQLHACWIGLFSNWPFKQSYSRVFLCLVQRGVVERERADGRGPFRRTAGFSPWAWTRVNLFKGLLYRLLVMGICNIVVEVSSLTGFRLNYETERRPLRLRFPSPLMKWIRINRFRLRCKVTFAFAFRILCGFLQL